MERVDEDGGGRTLNLVTPRDTVSAQAGQTGSLPDCGAGAGP